MSPVELPARTLLLFVLSVIGGSTDTISFLALNRLFLPNLRIVLAGARLGRSR